MSEQEKTNAISIAIKDKTALYASYMYFLRNGGLFIPTKKAFEIGGKLSFIITLLNDPEEFPINGTIVWVTPIGVPGAKTPGIGVQFEGETGKKLNAKLQKLLAANLNSEKPTYTM